MPAGSDWKVHVLDAPRPMCCPGCAAVAHAIVSQGLSSYYQYRTEMPAVAQPLVPDELQQLRLYDQPQMQQGFVSNSAGASDKEATLILEGITCAACIWLNEQHLRRLSGVRSVSIHYVTHRAMICWDEQLIQLSTILAEIRKLGYKAHPFSNQKQSLLRQQRRKQAFQRIAVAGLCAAQAMMIAVAFYAGAEQGLTSQTAQLLRWYSLLLTIPIMTYAATPFYRNAWYSLRQGNPGMDVPIVIGLLTGFGGSLYMTLQGQGGHVYYDTISMLVFFLLTTRYLERNACERAVDTAENLLRLVPNVATRMNAVKQAELVAIAEILPGDCLLIKPGETIPTDGVVLTGSGSADESLLTGESRPQFKQPGDLVLAGSINYENPLTVRVSAVGVDTMLASMMRLLERAQAEKPDIASLADRIARRFTWALLVLVVLVAMYWALFDSSRLVGIILSVLVVSCPCALSLAAPAAFAAAASHLLKRGLLLTRGHTLETLSKVNHVVFDKTGTLTLGKPIVTKIHCLSDLPEETCLALAASLEQASEHPLAKAIQHAARGMSLHAVQNSKNLPGQGLVGEVNGKVYRLFHRPRSSDGFVPEHTSSSLIYLSDLHQDIACFECSDRLRPDARLLIDTLHKMGLSTSILSGDNTPAVSYVGHQLGIDSWQANCTPEVKLRVLKEKQSQGQIVAMVGDGINDAPVLAAANAAIVMGSGTQLARTTGDAILMSNQLPEIAQMFKTSQHTMQVIRQNFIWAFLYNAIALPFAAVGYVSPLMAAVGMSSSSLIVILNALRLRQSHPR